MSRGKEGAPLPLVSGEGFRVTATSSGRPSSDMSPPEPGRRTARRLFILRYLQKSRLWITMWRGKLKQNDPFIKLHHLLLQFFLRMSKGAASSTRAASLLLHVTTHVCFVLAVLRRLETSCDHVRSENLCSQLKWSIFTVMVKSSDKVTCWGSAPFLLWF